MTKVVEVSQNEMQRITGSPHPLGYAKPKNALILIRKGLDQSTRKKVMAHEIDHIMKGEEGPFLTALAAGASLIGGLSASSAQNTATRSAEQGREQARSDLSPWRETGKNALSKLWSLMQGKTDISKQIQMDPEYRFRLQEGEQGQLAQQKATGMRLSGRAFKGMERFRQSLAGTASSNYLNRLMQLSTKGQNAAANQATASQNAASQIGHAGIMGAQGINQAIQGGVSNIIALKQQQDMLKLLRPTQ